MKRNFSIALIFLLLVTLLLLVVGCSRKVAPSTTSEKNTTDSTNVKTVEKFIKLPGDTIRITKVIECDPVTNKPKPFKETRQKGVAKQELEVDKDGKLTSKTNCDSLIKQRDKTIEHLKTSKTTETKIITVHEPYWFDIAARWVASISILSVAGYALYKFKTS